MNADRDLLLGLLALQLNFVDRQQLVAAFDRWCSDKTESLGRVLQSQGAIGEERLLLLEALVAEHLKLHDNDPQKSLADLSPLDSAREDLHRLADGDVEASLAHVSVARGRDGSEFPSTLSFPVGAATSAGTRFRVLRPHARGGLGEVFVAIDEELHREVALKEIQKRHADEADSRARFLLEAEITGGLEHPGIVPVYGLGTYADGRPFYAMRFIRGDSLKEAIARFHTQVTTPHPRSVHVLSMSPSRHEGGVRNRVRKEAFSTIEFRKLLGRFIDVCNAIEYAHSRGVLHRDLKPGNIMLGKYGETLVVDWGLAKVVGRSEPQRSSEEQTLRPTAGSGSTPTEMGRAVGTPQFMSPEQAEGRLDQIGPASDVYSLGATLYTLLTGEPPFTKDDTRDVVERVARGDFARPRVVNPEVPPGLEAVCLKAMARAPSVRYQSPQALASDIEHWLADEPVSALHETFVERVARWTRRHRALARSAAAALMVVSVVSVTAALVVDKARRDQYDARQLAQHAATKADDERRKAVQAEHDAEQAANSEKAQRIEAQRQSRISDAFRLATESRRIRVERPVRSLLLAAQAVRLAEDQEPVTQALRDALQSIGGRPFPGKALPDSLTFSPDSRWLAMARKSGDAEIWPMDAYRPGDGSFILKAHKNLALQFVFSNDGHWLATRSSKEMFLWDLKATPPRLMLPEAWHALSESFGFSPDSKWFAAIGADRSVRLWSAATQIVAPVNLQGAGARAAVFSPDGRWLVIECIDGSTCRCDLQTKDLGLNITILDAKRVGASEPLFSHDGHWLATGSDDGIILREVLADGTMSNPKVLRGYEGRVRRFFFTANSHRLIAVASVDAADHAYVWDLSNLTRQPTQIILTSFAFSPDSRWLATAEKSDAETADLEASSRSYLWDLNLATAQGAIVVRQFKAPQNVARTQFSPDGRWMVQSYKYAPPRLWDLTAAEPAANVLQVNPNELQDFTFSIDGRWLAVQCIDGTTRLLKLKASEPAATDFILRGHEAGVAHAAFSPDGRWLATASADFKARLWGLVPDEDKGSVTLALDDAPIFSLRFSEDGHSVLKAGHKRVEISPAQTSLLLTLADELAGRDLTQEEQSIVRRVVNSPKASNAVGRRGYPQNSRAAAVDSVTLALDWLAKHQYDDGSWRFANDADGTLEATGMVLLCFLGAGQTHKEGKYKEQVYAGLYSILENMVGSSNAGELMIGSRMSSHAICTLAMCEAFSKTRDRTLAGPAQAALNYLALAQDKVKGGWWPKPGKASDIETFGWVVSALKSGYLASLQVDVETLVGTHHAARVASGFLVLAQNAEGTAPNGDSTSHDLHTSSAISLLCHVYLGGARDKAVLRQRAGLIAQRAPTTRDMLYTYYATQLMEQLDAVDSSMCEEWMKKTREVLVKTQNGAGAEAGSWMFEGADPRIGAGGRLYCTAMATMTLQVSDGYLLLYSAKDPGDAINQSVFATALSQHGIELGRREKWRDAASQFAWATEMDAANAYWPLYLKGVTELAARETDSYRKTWRELYERFKDAREGERLGRIVYGFISANPEPSLSAEVVELAELYARTNPAWKRVVGGALFRDGQYAAALDTFAAAANHFPLRAWDLLIMAMAQQRIGQSADAQESYQAALALIQAANEKQWSGQWWERVEVEALRAEAERLFQETNDGD